MKLTDQRDLMAQAIAALLLARDQGIDTKNLINVTGWFLLYSSGRQDQWQERLKVLINTVQSQAKD